MEPAELREAMEKKNKTTERNESQIRIRKKKECRRCQNDGQEQGGKTKKNIIERMEESRGKEDSTYL